MQKYYSVPAFVYINLPNGQFFLEISVIQHKCNDYGSLGAFS